MKLNCLGSPSALSTFLENCIKSATDLQYGQILWQNLDGYQQNKAVFHAHRGAIMSFLPSSKDVHSALISASIPFAVSAVMFCTQNAFALNNQSGDGDYMLHLKQQRDGWLWETPGNAIVWKAFMEQAEAAGKAKDAPKQLALLESALEHSSCFKPDSPKRLETIAKLKECAEKQGKKLTEKQVQDLILPVTNTIQHPKYRMKPEPPTRAFKEVDPMIQEGDMLNTDGDTDQAVKIYLKTLKNLNERSARRGHEIVKVVDRLTRIYYKQGRFVEAEVMVRKELKAVESMHELLDDHDPDKLQIAFMLGDLALVYSGQERLLEAEALYKTALKTIHQNCTEKSYDYIVTLSELARVHKLMGKFDEADKEYRTTLTLSKGRPDCSNMTRGILFGNYAKLLTKMNKLSAAKEMEQKSTELMASSASAQHVTTSTSATRLPANTTASEQEPPAIPKPEPIEQGRLRSPDQKPLRSYYF